MGKTARSVLYLEDEHETNVETLVNVCWLKALSHYTAITRSCRGVVKFLRAPWDRRKMQKIFANNFAFSQDGDVTASLRRLWRFYGVPTECYYVPAEFQLATTDERAHGALTAC